MAQSNHSPSSISNRTMRPTNFSSLPPEQLAEIRRRFEAARLFQDDAEFLPEEVHCNTPTPGARALAKKPPARAAMPPPKVPKHPQLKKANTQPAKVAKVNKPSGLRQQQLPISEEPVETATRARSDTMSSQVDDDGRSEVATSDTGSMHTAHHSYGSTHSKASSILHPSLAVLWPPSDPRVKTGYQDGLMSGSWDQKGL